MTTAPAPDCTVTRAEVQRAILALRQAEGQLLAALRRGDGDHLADALRRARGHVKILAVAARETNGGGDA